MGRFLFPRPQKSLLLWGVPLQSWPGQVFPYDTANGLNSIDVLKQIRAEFPDVEITLIWDGAPYHRSGEVKTVASDLKIDLEPLPAYSPDFMPVEHLWQWLRVDVTYHTCDEKE